jgi:hypothetical protein
MTPRSCRVLIAPGSSLAEFPAIVTAEPAPLRIRPAPAPFIAAGGFHTQN